MRAAARYTDTPTGRREVRREHSAGLNELDPRARRRPFGSAPAVAPTITPEAHMAAFAALYPEQAAWLKQNATTSGFAHSLIDRIGGGCTLTDGQLVALKRASTAAEDCDPVLIEQAFERARTNDMKFPKLRLDGFKFSPGSSSGVHARTIFVKDGEATLAKIVGGKLVTYSICSDEQRTRILAAIKDPGASAIAYGQRTGECAVCGQALVVTKSVEMGIGPVCAKKFGFTSAYKELS